MLCFEGVGHRQYLHRLYFVCALLQALSGHVEHRRDEIVPDHDIIAHHEGRQTKGNDVSKARAITW